MRQTPRSGTPTRLDNLAPALTIRSISSMLFGRQNNLTRRAFRPDQQTVRQLRRQGMGKASLLDVQMGGRPQSFMERFSRSLRRWLRRR